MTQQGPPRAFWLVRSDGGGAVAEGVLWADGVVAVRWCGQGTAVSVWSGGLDALLAGHGRDGSTEVRWSEGRATQRARDEPTERRTGEAAERRTDEPAERPAERPVGRPGPYLPAPGADGRCVRCVQWWPCLQCGL
ncbi:hypothetical protein BWI15_18460 [Kribbella sp. ALI-6-A]|nr:hypothetical protein BWI15_18460 [Kribbella sp. ALI-6-A]